MASNNPLERPWSTDEIIENSENWNLAGDVALLNTLKVFADNLLSRTNDINQNLQNLTKGLDETTLKLNIAENEFQSLRNTQFIESRVYEDDESLPQNEEKVKIEEKNDPVEDIKIAALKGLDVLDRYFDKVEVSVSDSEDEDIELPNYVLRPKDLYIHRPLPYVIGSEDWHKTWHVGLEDSSSDSETEKVSDKFSESSEDDLPIIQDRSQIKGSDTSSEFDFSQKNDQKKEFFHSSDSENSVPQSANFAEQLAAKLGNVIQDYEPEVNTKPIQDAPKPYGDVFFDEPPPLDEPKGLFSGGGGLFDDEKIESPKISKGLFDERNSSDDDIFGKKKPSVKASLFEKPTIKAPLFSEEPPVLEEKKKPIGGVSIFGGDIFDKKLLKKQSLSDEDVEEKKVDLFEDLFKNSPKSEKLKIPAKNTQKINLFDSDEDDDKNLFVEPVTSVEKPPKKITVEKSVTSDENVTTSAEKTQKISLFDDDDLFKDDLFSTTSTKKSFTSGLFDDIPDDDIFGEKPTQANLFDDMIVENKNSVNNDVEKSDDFRSSPPPNIETIESVEEQAPSFRTSSTQDFFGESLDKNKSEVPIPATRHSLFDASPEKDEDDLFEKSPLKTDFLSSTPQKITTVPNLRLFDPSPPPDDDWDAKSETSDNDDFLNNFEEPKNVDKIEPSLFSEEPPILDFSETSPKKPGKLKHNLNINVGALMPGYVPLKKSEKIPEAITSSPEEITTSPIVTSRTVEKSGSYDETDNVQVLQSVTKARAKVPLNRRPSTRRGRKAALRNSMGDFKLDQENEEIEEKSKIEEKVENSSGSDDLFGITSSKTQNLPLFEDVKSKEKSREKVDDIIEPKSDFRTSERAENSTKSDDLFKTSPPRKSDVFDTPKKREKSKKSEIGLFDDEEDEDDLFTSKKPAQTKLKKSLFGDEDDNDDIFKSFSSASVKKTETKIATEKKLPKTSVKKLENTKPDDDPLSALLK